MRQFTYMTCSIISFVKQSVRRSVLRFGSSRLSSTKETEGVTIHDCFTVYAKQPTSRETAGAIRWKNSQLN